MANYYAECIEKEIKDREEERQRQEYLTKLLMPYSMVRQSFDNIMVYRRIYALVEKLNNTLLNMVLEAFYEQVKKNNEEEFSFRNTIKVSKDTISIMNSKYNGFEILKKKLKSDLEQELPSYDINFLSIGSMPSVLVIERIHDIEEIPLTPEIYIVAEARRDNKRRDNKQREKDLNEIRKLVAKQIAAFGDYIYFANDELLKLLKLNGVVREYKTEKNDILIGWSKENVEFTFQIFSNIDELVLNFLKEELDALDKRDRRNYLFKPRLLSTSIKNTAHRKKAVTLRKREFVRHFRENDGTEYITLRVSTDYE